MKSTFILIACCLTKLAYSFILENIVSYRNNSGLFGDNPLKNYTLQFLRKFSNSTIIEKFLSSDTECMKTINSLFSENNWRLLNNYFYSGKIQDDWGDYAQCIKHDNLYMHLKFKHMNISSEQKNEKFFVGLCMIKECAEVFDSIFKDGTKFAQYLEDTYSIKLLTNLTKSYTSEIQSQMRKEALTITHKLVIFFCLFYFILRFIFSLLGNFYFGKEFSQYNQENALSFYRKSVNVKSIRFQLKKLSYRIYSLISVINAFKYLTKIKSRVYNDKGIEIFLWIRILSLWGINFYALLIAYGSRLTNIKEINLSHYYMHYFMFKLFYYSHNVYIIISGLTFSYKLVSYVTANNNVFGYKIFIKFFMIAFSKAFLTYSSTAMVIFYSDQVYSLFGNSNLVKDTDVGMDKYNLDCRVKPLHLFIPLFLNFFNPSEKKEELPTQLCNGPFLLITTEFYLFFFFLIIFYLIYKLKSRIFEIWVCCVPVVLIIFLGVRYGEANENYYTNQHALFSLRKILKPQSLFVPYFLGVIVGILYFLNNNIMLLLDKNAYFPFEFFVKLNAFFHRRSNVLLHMLSYISILCMLIISANYAIIVKFYPSTIVANSHLNIKFDWFLNFLYLYEHKIFSIVVAFYLLLRIYIQNHTRKKIFLMNILIISRCSCAIILICDFVAHFIYLKIGGRLEQMNNGFFMAIFSISSFMLSCSIGVFLQICFEMPIRIFLIKYVFGKGENKNLSNSMRKA